MRAENFDTVFYVGGHGPMWDLAESTDSIALIESFYNSGKPVALVCHSPGVLHRVTYKGAPIVKGKRVTGFANSEEEEVHLTNVVPFLVEDELKRLGGIFEKAPNWQPFSIVDGDIGKQETAAKAVEAAIKHFGTIEFLVNNAGISTPSLSRTSLPRTSMPWSRPTCWDSSTSVSSL
jgi:putative intracellular protease/amidase